MRDYGCQSYYAAYNENLVKLMQESGKAYAGYFAVTMEENILMENRNFQWNGVLLWKLGVTVIWNS